MSSDHNMNCSANQPTTVEKAQREWVGLTDTEIREIDTSEFWLNNTPYDFARVIEAKLWQKNIC